MDKIDDCEGEVLSVSPDIATDSLCSLSIGTRAVGRPRTNGLGLSSIGEIRDGSVVRTINERFSSLARHDELSVGALPLEDREFRITD